MNSLQHMYMAANRGAAIFFANGQGPPDPRVAPRRLRRQPQTAASRWRRPPVAAWRTCATGHCYCLALPVRSAAPNWWPRTQPTSTKPRQASAQPFDPARPTKEGRGAVFRGDVACPAAALQGWLEAAQITEGSVFALFAAAATPKPSASLTGRSVTSSRRMPSASAQTRPCSQATRCARGS